MGMRGKYAYSEEVLTQSTRGESGTQSEKYIRGYTAAQDHGNCGRLRLGKILARTWRALRGGLAALHQDAVHLHMAACVQSVAIRASCA